MEEYVYEEKVVEYLKKNALHIAFAESCTGGLACANLVSVSGASSVLSESYVTYAVKSKVNLLGVKADTIEKYGVVSEEVARKMAKGAAEKSGAEIGVGITGFAGPRGENDEKEVGTVCFGACINGALYSKTVCFGEIGRNEVRKEAAKYVFSMLNSIFSQN